MKAFFIFSLFALAAIMPLYLLRAFGGPTVFDRLIGLNGIATKAVLFLVLTGIYFGNADMFLDIALGYGLLNLVGSLAAAKYLESRAESA